MIDPTLLTAIASLILGVGGAWTAWNTSRVAARKDEVNILRESLVELRSENTRLLSRIRFLEMETFAYQRWARNLVNQLISLGHTPVQFEPPTIGEENGKV